MRSFLTHVPRIEARAAILALAVAIVLTGLKFLAYFLTGSAAVFSDALESIVNVAAAAMVIYALSYAHRPADASHPYGHGKIEFLSAGLEGGMILLAALAAALKAGDALLHRSGIQDGQLGLGLLLMAVALVVNGAVGLYLVRLGRRQGSLTLVADGRHLLSDAITSVAAVIALVIVRFSGWAWADPAAALLVSAYIAWAGIDLLRHSFAGLMDKQDAADEALLTQILDAHLGPQGKEPRICGYHKLRHRHSGRYHWVDFHVMLPAEWDIDRGHRVASSIEYEIEQALGEGNATAHVEPCGDQGCGRCGGGKSEVRNAKSETSTTDQKEEMTETGRVADLRSQI